MQGYRDMSSQDAFVEGDDASAEAFFIDAFLHLRSVENRSRLHASAGSQAAS